MEVDGELREGVCEGSKAILEVRKDVDDVIEMPVDGVGVLLGATGEV